jgi:hypothetical protein
MPKLTVITPCDFHVSDVSTLEVDCFHSATWNLLELLHVEAEIYDIPALLRQWLAGENDESITLEFEDSYFQNMTVIYTAE